MIITLLLLALVGAAARAPRVGLAAPGRRGLLQQQGEAAEVVVQPQQSYKTQNQQATVIPAAAVVSLPLPGGGTLTAGSIDACVERCRGIQGCDYVWYCSEQVRAAFAGAHRGWRHL